MFILWLLWSYGRDVGTHEQCGDWLQSSIFYVSPCHHSHVMSAGDVSVRLRRLLQTAQLVTRDGISILVCSSNQYSAQFGYLCEYVNPRLTGRFNDLFLIHQRLRMRSYDKKCFDGSVDRVEPHLLSALIF